MASHRDVLVNSPSSQLDWLSVLGYHENGPLSVPVITRHRMTPTTPSRAATPVVTLADVLATVNAADLAERRRQDLASAVRTVARLLDRKPEEIPADPRALALRLKAIAPIAAGLSARRWNNIRSLLRAALEHVRPMMRGRSLAPLSPAWQTLADRISTRTDSSRLSRLMRWMSANGVAPATVTPEMLEAFRTQLEADSLLPDPAKTWAALAWSWNRSVERVEGWPQLRIAKPWRKDTYTLPWSAFPISLKRDVDGWLDRLAGRDFSDDGPPSAARPSTLATREYQLRAFASALVLSGRNALSMTSLADLVTPDAFVTGLKFHHGRRGNTTSRAIHGLAGMLKGVARHWVKVDDAALAKMAAVTKRLAVPEQGLTAKNQNRLRPFDNEEMARRLLSLPQRLRGEADSSRLPPQRAAVLAGIAVAIELLIVAPVRRQNLVSIDLERHLVRTGRKLHLVVPAAEVKNAVDLEFELPERTVELIEWYRQRWRPLLAPSGSTALFPGRSGQPKAKHTLGQQVSEVVFKYTGLRVNVHLFRHIDAKLYLDAVPGGYEVLRRVFGHKKIETTARFYTGFESKAAARHFDNVILSRLEADRADDPRMTALSEASGAKMLPRMKSADRVASRPRKQP